MKPVMQTVTGLRGNCLSACIASLMEISIEEVPNFHEGIGHKVPQDDPEGVKIFWKNVMNFLYANGYSLVHLDASEGSETLTHLKGYYLVGGESPRGYQHAVIYHNGKLAHDPHPEGGGVVAETVSIIYPLFEGKKQ